MRIQLRGIREDPAELFSYNDHWLRTLCAQCSEEQHWTWNAMRPTHAIKRTLLFSQPRKSHIDNQIIVWVVKVPIVSRVYIELFDFSTPCFSCEKYYAVPRLMIIRLSGNIAVLRWEKNSFAWRGNMLEVKWLTTKLNCNAKVKQHYNGCDYAGNSWSFTCGGQSSSQNSFENRDLYMYMVNTRWSQMDTKPLLVDNLYTLEWRWSIIMEYR